MSWLEWAALALAAAIVAVWLRARSHAKETAERFAETDRKIDALYTHITEAGTKIEQEIAALGTRIPAAVTPVQTLGWPAIPIEIDRLNRLEQSTSNLHERMERVEVSIKGLRDGVREQADFTQRVVLDVARRDTDTFRRMDVIIGDLRIVADLLKKHIEDGLGIKTDKTEGGGS